MDDGEGASSGRTGKEPGAAMARREEEEKETKEM
jgi:hypothetical protein